MSEQAKILVVDDSKENRLLLTMLLEDDYIVSEAESGEECLKMVEQDCPELILLDVNMPGLSGYQVCENLRRQSETEDLPIIFVSGLDSIEERLAGFEAGGDEYIIKPVDGAELINKVQSYLQKQKERHTVHQEAAQAMKIAMEAMTVSSELGQIVEFVKQGQSLETCEAIGQAILGIAQDFQLNTSVMVVADEILYFGCGRDSMEAQFLQKAAKSRERIITLGVRTVIRNDNIVLLIKDMPIEDENRSGRLRDHLAVLMDIANGYLNNLNTQVVLKMQRRDFLNRIIAISEAQIKATSEKLHAHEQSSTGIMQGMVEELESMLFGLGLDEDQEKTLMHLADQTSLKLTELNRSTQDLDKELGVILESLYQFLANNT